MKSLVIPVGGSPAEAKETHLAEKPRFQRRVGLLAGGGRFPFYFAEAARKRGIEVVCVGIRDHADADLKDAVDRFYWTGIGKLGFTIRCFLKEEVDGVVMAGKVRKAAIFVPWRLVHFVPDCKMIKAWFSRNRSDNRDDSILLMIIREFQKEGLRVASALEVCPELLVQAGLLTKKQPTREQLRDVAFGWRLAKEMGRLDIGQCVAIKEQAVLAVEAIEGTDQAILRAGELCPAGGFTVVKVAKPAQDMRFDVPTIGVATIESMRRAGAAVLAMEAQKTILIDADQAIQMADRLGIVLISLAAGDAANLHDVAGAA